jgi:hypothetical protein
MCPISVEATSGTRSLLECVQRIVAGVGETAPSTVASPKPTTTKAIHAVQDALSEIYTRAAWDFRFAWFVFDLAADTMWYDLPSDFAEVRTDLPLYLGTSLLKHTRFEDLLKAYPDFREFPPSAGVGASLVTQGAAMTNHFGSPLTFTLLNEQLGLFPIPDSDFVTEQAQGVVGYLKLAPELTEDGDLLPLPQNLWVAHYYLSLSFLKQALEFKDFVNDEERAERYLAKQIGIRTRRVRSPIIMKPRQLT